MRRKITILILSGLFLLIISSVVFFGKGFSPAFAWGKVGGESPPISWRDDFDGFFIDSRWTIINEETDFWDIYDGFLELQLDPTPLNIFFQAAPASDFTIETYVELTPNENFQQAGLIINGDQSDYNMVLSRAYCNVSETCNENAIYFDLCESGVCEDNHSTPVAYLDSAYLRLTRSGDEYFAYVSPDGENWSLIGSHTPGFIPEYIGLIAATGGQTTGPKTARFDYFDLSFPDSMSAFTYQGMLGFDGIPLDDSCDFQFSLYDNAGSGSPPAGGNQVGQIITKTNVPVFAGSFTVNLDFRVNPYQGQQRYLEIAVRCPTGNGAYSTLSPRQLLTSVPYAVFSYHTDWQGVQNIPDGFADGTDDNTEYAAGTGLNLLSNNFSLESAFQLPQACEPFQVPVWDSSAGGWGCGTVALTFTPSQQTGHQINFNDLEASQDISVDLSSLGNQTEVVDSSVIISGTEVIAKIPGRHSLGTFDVLCTGSCDDLVTMRSNVETHQISRVDVRIDVFDPAQNLAQEWVMQECWPYKYITELTKDRQAVQMRFSFTCELQTTTTYNQPGPSAAESFNSSSQPGNTDAFDSVHGVDAIQITGNAGGLLELTGGISVPFFADHLGLGSETEIIEHKSIISGTQEYIYKLPGRIKWPVITIICDGYCPDLVELRQNLINGISSPRDGTLRLLNEQAAIYGVWDLSSCWPSSLSVAYSPDGTETFPMIGLACNFVEFVR